MTPVPLYIQKLDGFSKSHVFYCSTCRITYQNKELCEKCCKCYICGEEVKKNKDAFSGDRGGSYSYHEKCQQLDNFTKSNQREKTRFESAEKIDVKNYDGWVYLEGTGNEGFSESIDELLEDYWGNYDFSKDCPDCGHELKIGNDKTKEDYLSYLQCQNPECNWKSPEYEVIDDIYHLFVPEYVWACEEIPFSSVDLDTVMKNISENGYEDILDHIKGEKELQLAIDKFNDLNKDLVSYIPDYKKAIIGLKEYVKNNK